MKSFLPDAKITKNIRRSFWTRLYDIEINGESATSSNEILLLLSKAAASAFRSLPVAAELLTNIQGRDSFDTHPQSPEPLNQQEKELLLVTGTLPEIDELCPGANPGGPFIFRASTAFNSFSGSHDITNKLLIFRENIPETYTLKNLLDIPEIKIELLRFGAEFFSLRSKLFSFLLTPTVTDYIYLEAGKKNACWHLLSESLVTAEAEICPVIKSPELADLVDLLSS